MPNIEKQLQLAADIVRLRSELAAKEAEFAGMTAKPKPGPRGKGPSISARVLNIIRQAGPNGVPRRDILAAIPQEEAVHSALKAHSAAGRIHSEGGAWVFDPPVRETRPIRIPSLPPGVEAP